ncbi:MAG: hypothetical protein QNJ47_26565 [Nostocaceae cyanobacterium]|nr:hypothetical protein [Nostocaceae cyanobacterium]
MTEASLTTRYLTDLEPHFHIKREVMGTHFSGKRLRLDAVLKPKIASSWKREDVAFGIEFKDTERFAQNYDTKNLTKWLAQCVDYSNTDWDDFGYLYIFCCPSLLDEVPESVLPNPNLMFVRNFMGQMGIGEIKYLPRYGLSILVHGHHRIWSATKGVEYGKTYKLDRCFGSR